MRVATHSAVAFTIRGIRKLIGRLHYPAVLWPKRETPARGAGLLARRCGGPPARLETDSVATRKCRFYRSSAEPIGLPEHFRTRDFCRGAAKRRTRITLQLWNHRM